MKSYIDKDNLYLRKYLSQDDLDKYMTTWFFLDEKCNSNMINIFSHKKVYSFLWEYYDDHFSIKINDWKRAFKRYIQIPMNVKFYEKDYISNNKKIYLDVIESENLLSEEFKNFTAYNLGENFTQIIVDKEEYFLDLELNFLNESNSINRFVNFIKILDLENVDSIILNGYHHRGELIKLFIHRKDFKIDSDSILEKALFENTYISRPFNWEEK